VLVKLAAVAVVLLNTAIATAGESGWLWQPGLWTQCPLRPARTASLGLPLGMEAAEEQPVAAHWLTARRGSPYAGGRTRIWLIDGQPAESFDLPPSGPLGPDTAAQTIDPQVNAPLQSAWPETIVVWRPETTFYARADYFEWRETADRYRLLRETGVLATVGMLRRRDFSRFRVEVFGSRVDYDGATMDGEPFKSNTDYLGFQAQFDLLWPLQFEPNTALVLGVGTRLWNRKLLDGQTASGTQVTGYEETWWTLYPYIGLESRCPTGKNSELFASVLMGFSTFTYEFVPEFDVALYPKLGPVVQAEFGVQGGWLMVSGFVQVMKWYASDVVGDVDPFYQPDSLMVTVGINAGIRF